MIGILPVDKPEGPTSHDVVGLARRSLGTRRIGHTGTLDPFATGLLLLCIGRATRLAEYLTGLDKSYEAIARLGVATDTLDRTGAIAAESHEWEHIEPAAIRAAFEDQTGTRMQVPPAYSAKRLGGRRAYARARAGERVEPEPVEVTIRALEVTAVEGAEVRFRMRCSSGTYVRAVARDAGEGLGVGAHLTALRRTSIGGFDVRAALTPDALSDSGAVANALIAPLEALGHLPRVQLEEGEAERIGHGRTLPAGGRVGGTGPVVLAEDDRLVAIAELDGRNLRPRKVFT